jgi:hypothetical protein
MVCLFFFKKNTCAFQLSLIECLPVNRYWYPLILGGKEAERYALDLQNRVNLGRVDKPQKDHAAGASARARAGHEGAGCICYIG